MNQKRLKKILQDLKGVVYELESEVYADKDSYLSNLHVEYNEILEYIDYNDDDGDGI